MNRLPIPISRYHDTVKVTMVALLVASLPFHYHISSVLILLGAFQYLLHSLRNKRFHFNKLGPLSFIFFAYFLLECFGLAYTDAQNLAYGFSFIEMHHAMILIPLIFIDYKIDSRLRKQLFTSFCLSCLCGCIISVIVNIKLSLDEYGMIFHPWRFSHLRLAEPIGLTPIYFSLFVAMCTFILLEHVLENGSFSKAGIAGPVILMIFFIFFLISLGARTVIVTTMLIAFARILFYSKRHGSFRVLAIASLIPLVFACIIFLNPVAKVRFMDMMKETYEGSNYGSYYARWKIWEPGLELIKENILFGVGTGDHQSALNQKYIEHNFQEGVGVFNMHNQYMQTMVTIGIPGLVILLFALGEQLTTAIRRKDALYISFIVLFTLSFLTESILNRNKGIIFFLIFSFIFYNTKTNKEAVHAPRP